MNARGNFFAIDRRAWAAVCGLGSINAAVAYLVLARGTLGDMRTTAWSVNAIENHTGVARHLAQTAIKRLSTSGIIEQTRGGTKPLYRLRAPHEFPGPKPAAITAEEDALLQIIENEGRSTFVPKTARYDSEWPTTNPYKLACDLVRKGHLTDDGRQFFGLGVGPELVSEESDWIWLPTSLIEGAASETAPIELLRQAQNLAALRLLIDLYHAQSLPRHGGVHWRTIRRTYEKAELGSYGAHTVWGFSIGNDEAWLNRPVVEPHVDHENPKDRLHRFWPALRLLESTGLAAFVAHVVEADSDEAAVLFPYGGTLALDEEMAVGEAAGEAGLAMLTEWQEKTADTASMLLVPLLSHQSRAVMVGLLRLRYQAATAANAEWHQRRPQWAEQAKHFRKLAEKAYASQSFATSTRHQI